jgi:hypothetical protein
MPGWKPSRYASEVFASEAVVRTWSIQFPWLDRPDLYRSGSPTRTLAAHFAGKVRKSVCKCKKLVGAFRKSVQWSIEKLQALGMKSLKDTVSLTIEIPRGVYELAVRHQVALKDEPGCETLNDYIVSAIDSAIEDDERIHQLKARRFVR